MSRARVASYNRAHRSGSLDGQTRQGRSEVLGRQISDDLESRYDDILKRFLPGDCQCTLPFDAPVAIDSIGLPAVFRYLLVRRGRSNVLGWERKPRTPFYQKRDIKCRLGR